MVSIWGYEIRSKTLRQTPFVCPRCGLDRDGTEIEPQRWFAVLHIRVIPLATFDRVIQCDTCGHRCDIGVLEIPTTELLAEYLCDAMRHSVIATVRAGIEISDDPDSLVRDAAVAAVQATDHDYDDAGLDHDLIELDDNDMGDRLRRLVRELTPHGKQSFLHRMTGIALADGMITPRERRTLIDIGVALGMAPPHINGVLAVATNQYEVA